MRRFLPNTEAGPSLRLYRAPLWSQTGATRSGGKVLLPEAVGDVELRVHYTHTNTNFWLWESARDITTNTRVLALSAQMGPLCVAGIRHSTVQNVLTLLSEYFFWFLLCCKYRNTHMHAHVKDILKQGNMLIPSTPCYISGITVLVPLHATEMCSWRHLRRPSGSRAASITSSPGSVCVWGGELCFSVALTLAPLLTKAAATSRVQWPIGLSSFVKQAWVMLGSWPRPCHKSWLVSNECMSEPYSWPWGISVQKDHW